MAIVRAIWSALLVVVLGACATPMQRNAMEEAQTAGEMGDDVRRSMTAYAETIFAADEGIYLGDGRPIAVERHDGRGALLEQPVGVDRGALLTLQQIAELLQSTTGVRVLVTADAVTAAGTVQQDPFEVEAASGAAGSGSPTVSVAGAIRVSYSGTLRGFLDYVTSRTGTYWEWGDEGIVISYLKTVTYRVTAIPGAATLDGTMGAGSSGSGGGGGGGEGGGGGQGGGGSTSSMNSTSMSASVQVMEPLVEAIRSMRSPAGEVALSAGLGLITVTDTPVVHARVKTLIDRVNSIAMRQAVIDVQVVTVDLRRGENFGLDWTIVREALNGLTASTGVSFGQNPSDVNTASFAVIDPSYNYAGSSLVLKALATQGTVTVQTNAAVPTLSNMPVPINVVDETAYLERITANVVEGSGTVQVTVTPGIFTTGFSMQMLPVILDNDEILLQFGMTVAQLRELRTVSAGGAGANQIEVPALTKRDTMQRVRLKSGQTLALWGFEQSRSRSDGRGVGRPDFMLAGGGSNTAKERTVLVILVTPRVID
jgi:type IVB pilus formation R64 PilN family outer membrane protein